MFINFGFDNTGKMLKFKLYIQGKIRPSLPIEYVSKKSGMSYRRNGATEKSHLY